MISEVEGREESSRKERAADACSPRAVRPKNDILLSLLEYINRTNWKHHTPTSEGGCSSTHILRGKRSNDPNLWLFFFQIIRSKPRDLDLLLITTSEKSKFLYTHRCCQQHTSNFGFVMCQVTHCSGSGTNYSGEAVLGHEEVRERETFQFLHSFLIPLLPFDRLSTQWSGWKGPLCTAVVSVSWTKYEIFMGY